MGRGGRPGRQGARGSLGQAPGGAPFGKDQAAHRHSAYRRYLKLDGAGLKINEAAAQDESRLDGKYVLRTDSSLGSEEVAAAYKPPGPKAAGTFRHPASAGIPSKWCHRAPRRPSQHHKSAGKAHYISAPGTPVRPRDSPIPPKTAPETIPPAGKKAGRSLDGRVKLPEFHHVLFPPVLEPCEQLLPLEQLRRKQPLLVGVLRVSLGLPERLEFLG